MTRFSAIGICSVGILSSSLIGCGDGETGVAKTSLAGEVGGGGAANGGASGSGNGGAEQGGSPAGGTTTSTGGVAVAGAGGAASGGVSGSTSMGGVAAGQGGAVTSGAGGATTAGNTSTGGATTAGNTSTGGATTAGNTSTGGATVAGNTGTGGAATGGVGTGGVGTGGTTTVPVACTANFVLPANGETLTEADDVTGAYCANGFFYDVIVATDAPNGTTATLTVGNATPVAAIVQNAVARFPSTQMGTSGTQNLSIQVAASAGLTACTASESVTVNCLGHSTCAISKPTFPATHIALNGVAVAQGGDRVSSEGSPYQAVFEVTTDIEDGQPVALTVTNGTTPTTSYAVAMAGKATFPGVTFVPDGTYSATASCQARSGAKATSLALPVPVDTTGPDLVVTKGTGAGAATISALADGDHFGPSDDSDPTTGLQLKICGTTAAPDALGIDAGVFGSLANNFCVATGGNTPVCAPALTSTSNGACVNFPCPGNGPFDLTVTLKDKAQNSRTTTAQNVTCAATNPVVQFLDPVSGGDGATPASFTDKSLRILAASATGTGQKKDKTAATLGAQFDVVVCTSAPAGSSAILSQGWYGDTSLTQLATATVAADTGSICSGSQPSVVVFSNITLNESTVKADFTLDRATELGVTITDLNFGSTTAKIDVWVDSVAPSLNLIAPANICGSYVNSGTASIQTLTFGSPVVPVTATVTPGSGSATSYSSTQPLSAFSQVAITGVSFPLGTSVLTAVASKPSGNSAAFPSIGTCQVVVGTTPPPIVTWIAATSGSSPISSSLLTAPGNTTPGAIADSNTGAAGWQGTLRACANLTGAAASGVTMQFAVNGTDVGVAQNLNQSDGCAVLAVTDVNVVPEGMAVQLTARTSATVNGVGTGSITVPVDVTIPSTPTGLNAVTKSRRQTSFTLTWSLPVSGSPATDYEVRVSKVVIDDSTKFAVAETVPFNGTPQALGQVDSIDVLNRYLENGYFFAVQSIDSVGNRSGIAYTSTAKIERFIQMEIPAPVAGTNFGWTADGTADLNGDTYSDLVVGSSAGSNVYIYFGTSSGYATTPSVTIQGTASGFGSALAVVGDLNKDGRNDVVIGSPAEGNGVVYVFYAPATWPAFVTTSNASVVLSGDTTTDGNYTNAKFGQSVTRLGDFNGDGVDDVAIGVPYYNSPTATTSQGQVIVLYGKSGGLATSIKVPGAFAAQQATRIDGDPVALGRIGYWVTSLGYFYGTSGGTSLMTAAPWVATAAGANSGRLYSFGGKSGTAPSISFATARHTFDSPVGGAGLGFYALPVLGDVGPGGQFALGVPFLLAASSNLQIRSGTVADGPFGQLETITTSESSAGRVFARYSAGGGVAGTSLTMSLVGSTRSDIAIASLASANPRLFVVDGSKTALSVAGTSVDVASVADVTVPLLAPSTGTWTATARGVTLVRDADADGYADVALGDVSFGAVISGRVVILR